MRIFHCAVKGSADVCVCVCVFINHEKLAHSTVDIEKSHDLLSTSWRPGKARDESKDLRTSGRGRGWVEGGRGC